MLPVERQLIRPWSQRYEVYLRNTKPLNACDKNVKICWEFTHWLACTRRIRFIDQISPKEVDGFLRQLRTKSQQCRLRYHFAIKSMFKFWISECQMDIRNPADEVKVERPAVLYNKALSISKAKLPELMRLLTLGTLYDQILKQGTSENGREPLSR